MFKQQQLLFIFFLLFFNATTLFAFQITTKKYSHQSFQFPILEYYDDSSASLSIDAVKQCYTKGLFCTEKKSKIIEPHKYYWIRFVAFNTNPNDLMWTLHLHAQISKLWIYTCSLENNKEQFLHCDSSFVQESMSFNTVIVPLPYNRQTVCYLKLQNTQAELAQITKPYLEPLRDNNTRQLANGCLIGVLLGALFFMFLYSLFLYVHTPKKVFLYYLFYILFIFFYFLCDSFIGEKFLLNSNPLLCIKAHVFLLVSMFFYFLFIRAAVLTPGLEKLDRYVIKPCLVLVGVSAVVCGIFLFGFGDYFPISLLVCASFVFVFSTVIIIGAWNRTTYFGRTILTGTLIMIIGGLLSIVFAVYNQFETNIVFNYSVLLELFIFVFALSKYQKNLENEKRQNQLELQDSKHRLELNHRELAQKALHVVQQDQLLLSLKQQLNNLIVDNKEDSHSLAKIVNEVDVHIKQQSWDDFEKYFIVVHPNFYKTIKQSYPLLTQQELRLCALIRLNLTTKEIAAITQKTVRSLEVMRSRIRQKMGLCADDSLFDAMMSFDIESSVEIMQ